MPENWKLANAAITDMQMRQRKGVPDAKYTKELVDAKAENDARVMMLPLVASSVAHRSSLSVSEATTASGVDTPAPTGRHQERGLFLPQREADRYAKTTGRNPEVY